MKKRLIVFFIFLLIFNLMAIQLMISQDMANLAPNIPIIGKVNENTGLPDSFEKFRSIGQNLSDEEKSKEYLKQEWTKLLAENKFISPVFFYTNEFFSNLNPFWEFVFQMKFAWSWEFIFCLAILIVLIIMIYMPVKDIFDVNPFLTLVIGFVISCIVGKSGVIKQSADTLTFAVKNIWLAVVCLIIAIIITLTYSYIMAKLGKNLKEKSKEEDLKNAKDAIIIHGKLSQKAIKEEYK